MLNFEPAAKSKHKPRKKISIKKPRKPITGPVAAKPINKPKPRKRNTRAIINRRTAFGKPTIKQQQPAGGSPATLEKTATQNGYKHNPNTNAFEHSSGSKLQLHGKSWTHFSDKGRKTKNGRGVKLLQSHLTKYHNRKPRQPKQSARSKNHQQLFERLHHHIFNNLEKKVQTHIHKIMEPMSQFRQNLAAKLADTPKIIKKAFPKKEQVNKAAESLRDILRNAAGHRRDIKEKSKHPLISDEHKDILYKILKAGGIHAVQAAALASGTPLMYFATPEIARHVYEHWNNEGERSKPEEQSNGEQEPEEQQQLQEGLEAIKSQNTGLEGEKSPENTEQIPSEKAAKIKIKNKQEPLVPMGKFMVDWRHLNNEQLLNKFISMLRAHLRSGTIPKKSIENALRMHPKEFSGSSSHLTKTKSYYARRN